MAPSSAKHSSSDSSESPHHSGRGSEQAWIPLTPESPTDTDGSLGSIVKDASTHVSTLVRAEIELAKLEVTASVKQALKGSIFFAAAAAIGLFSLWFFWLAIGWIIAIWLPTWAAFCIVFGAMIVMAGLLAVVGLGRMKKIKKPEKTISEAQATAEALKKASTHDRPTHDRPKQGRGQHHAA